jgi:hypothetical protein
VVKEAGVLERGHAVLNSGRHTMHKVHLDRIIDHPEALEMMLDALLESAMQLEVEAIVPVPTGARRIVEASPYPFPHDIAVIAPLKLGPRQFEFSPRAEKKLKRMGRVAIFEDVVTTGGTPAAVASDLHRLNSDMEVHLIDGWMRGKVARIYESMFVSQTHIIASPITDWAPKDCPYHKDEIG